MKPAGLRESHSNESQKLFQDEVVECLLCPSCRSASLEWTDSCQCKSCKTTIRVDDHTILYFEEIHQFDLRVAAEPLDIRKFENERLLFDTYIENDVEFVGRLHSIKFVNRHASLLSDVSENKIVVDLGGGQAPYIDAFEKRPRVFFDVDLSKPCLTKLRLYHDDRFPLVLLHHNVVENLPFADSSVDVVISCEVIEHLDDPAKHLSEIHRILKPGGVVSLSTPCASMYFYPHNFINLRHRGAFKDWLKKINSDKHWSEALSWHPGLRPSVLRRWMNDAGFDVSKHSSTLWYYHTPHQYIWRILKYLDKNKIKSASRIWGAYLGFTEWLLRQEIPLLRWAGIRQFILCKKPSLSQAD